MTQPQNVLFREIHKNAWLKRLQTVDKRNGAFPKKGERVWVVFCVHDDSEAFLEIYMDQKLAVAHKPDWFLSLNNCLHISPTICAQEDEYEFVITLNSEVIRLAAPSWDIMMEWVETIRSKLQEMRILSPRENIYSKMPEARLPLAPTRDPNSPLPPTPMGPSARVPGIEPVHLDSVAIIGSHANPLVSETEIENVEMPTNGANYEIRSSTALYITQSEPPVYTRPRHVLNRAVSVPDSSSYGSSLRISPGPRTSAASNVTVIEVSATNLQGSHSALPLSCEDVFNFNEMETYLNCLENAEAELPQQGNNCVETSFNSTPNTPPFGANNESHSSHVFSNFSRTETNNITAIASTSSASASVNSDNGHTAGTGDSGDNGDRKEETLGICGATCLNYELSSSLDNCTETLGHYECVFFPSQNSPVPDSTVFTPANAASHSRPVETSSTCLFSRCLPLSINVDSQVQITQSEQVLSAECSNGAHSRQRSRSTSLSEGSSSRPCVSSSVSADRNPSGGATRGELERRLQSPPHPYRYIGTGHNTDTTSPGRLTLREQQVLQLRREMIHPGGVRLQLRRKDCTNSIALVDAFGAVWIAGWKQKEHPMLYNALHIGDHLVSTCGVLVQNANDAQKLIRGTSSLYVEFVLRRVPCGRVFAIRRDCEGQSLGIVQEGNTAEIKDVVPGSPAARHGLAPRAPTCDGLSLTNWVLTEINGRPLNLFFKDGEVRDRLNAVGRDISILVQPADLVKHLKKQLKSIRSYKDYIVQ